MMMKQSFVRRIDYGELQWSRVLSMVVYKELNDQNNILKLGEGVQMQKKVRHFREA